MRTIPKAINGNKVSRYKRTLRLGLVTINSIESLEEHISEFNNYFSGIGVKLERDEVKTECVHELEKLDSISKEKYLWLSSWLGHDSSKRTF